MKHLKKFESYSREDIAREVGEDPSVFDDSKDLGSVADKISDEYYLMEEAKEYADYIWEEFEENYDFSPFFTKEIEGFDVGYKNKIIKDALDFTENKIEEYSIFNNKLENFIKYEIKTKISNKLKLNK